MQQIREMDTSEYLAVTTRDLCMAKSGNTDLMKFCRLIGLPLPFGLVPEMLT